jgi:hypothetical protein
MGADELAPVAGQTMGAGGADLAVVFHGGIINRAGRIALSKIRRNFIIKDAWPGGKHG